MKPRIFNVARLSLPLATALASLLAMPSIHAQSWSSSATSGAWLTTTNWTGGVAAGSSTDTANTNIAVFNVNVQNTIGIAMSSTGGVYYLGAIDNTNNTARTINNGSTTAGVLTLNGATVNSVANTIVRNTTGSLLTITNGSGAGTMGLGLGNATNNIIQITGAGGITIPSIISGVGRNLTRQGSGTGVLILSGANSYTGTTTVSAGVINIQNATALGAVAGGTTVTSGAALQIQNNITVGAEPLSLSGTGIANDGALRNISGNNTFGGLITLGSAARINSNTFATTLTLTGGITATNQNVSIGGIGNTTVNTTGISTGTGSLTKDGVGTLTLNAANTYTGVTNLLEGRLNITRESALYNGDAGSWTASKINVKAGATMALNVHSAGTSGFTEANLATLLSNISVANSATQGLQANAILGLDTSNAGGSFAPTSAITDSTGTFGGAISLNKLGTGALVLDLANTYTGQTIVSAGTLQLGSGGTTGALSSSSAITVASGATFVIDQTDTVTQGIDFSGAPISGTGGFTQAGTGTTILTEANTFTGTTTVSNGILQLNNALALQNSTLSTSGLGTVTLGPGVTSPTFGGVSGGVDLATIIPDYSSVTNFVLSTPAGSTLTYGGIIANGAPGMSLTKAGLGTQILTGENTYTGATIINAGTLTIGNGSAGSLNGTAGTALTFTGTGIFNVAEAASSTQGMGVLSLSAGDGTVTSTATGATSAASLTFGSLTARTPGATGNFTLAVNTTSTGATPNLIAFTNAANLPPDTGSNNSGIFFGGSNYARYDALGFVRAVAYGTDTNANAALSGAAVADLGTIGATIDARFNGGTRATSTSGVASATNTNTLAVTNGSLFTVGQIITGTNIAPNTYITAISGNTLTLANPIQASIRATAVAAGATLTPYNSVTTQTTGSLNTLNLQGTGASLTLASGATLSVNGILRSGSSNAGVISGGSGIQSVTSGGEIVVRANTSTDVITIATPILDNNGSSLTKSGAGELYLNGANTYSGDTIINGGIVGINNPGSFGAGKVLVKGSSTIFVNGSGGGSGVTYPNDIDVGAPLTLRIPLFINNQGNPGNQIFSGKLTGSNPITVAATLVNGGEGRYQFTHAENTFTGDIIMPAGSSGTADGNDHFTFKSLGDGGNIVFRKRGHRCSVEYIGDAPIVFNSRRIALGSEFGNGAFDGGGAEPINSFRNNATSSANTVTFNTSILPATVSSAVVPGYLFFAGNNTGDNTFAGVIPDMLNQPLNIGKNDSGRWILSGLNTYSGAVWIANGTLAVNLIDLAKNNQPLGKNPLIQLGNAGVSGNLEYIGTADASTDKQVVLGNLTNNNQVGGGGIINNSETGTLTFSNPVFNNTTGATVTTVARTLTLGGSNDGANTIAGIIGNNNTAPVAVTKTGAGTWTLSAVNTYTGATTISGGTLRVSGSGQLGAGTYGGAISNNGTLQYSSSATQTLSGNMTGSGALIKDVGASNLTLSGNSNFSGGTSLNAGTITVNSSTALGTGEVSMVAGTRLLVGVNNVTLANNITLNGSATSGALYSGDFAAGNVTNFTGIITLAATSNVSTWWNDKTLRLSGKITGPGGLNFIRQTTSVGGRFFITGADNDYAGNTSVTGDSAPRFGYTGQAMLYLGATNALPVTTNLTLNNADLYLNGQSQTLPSITGTGTFSIQNGSTTPAALTLGFGDVSSTLAGAILDNGIAVTNTSATPTSVTGRVSLTKIGSGTLTLTAANTFTGDTVVEAGTLTLADNAQLKFVLGATSGSNNSISGAGTAVLDGDFVIDTTAADALPSGTWTLENVSPLTGAYGSTFTVVGFTDAGSNKWTKINGSKIYTFDETTGILTLAPNVGYSTWAAVNAIGSAANLDKDGDGVSNAVEYVLGGDVNTNDLGKLPTLDASGANLVFTFKRDRDSLDGNTAVVIEVGDNLTGWPDVFTVGTTTGTSTAGVTVTESSPEGFDTITLSVPKGVATKKFARLKVTVTE